MSRTIRNFCSTFLLLTYVKKDSLSRTVIMSRLLSGSCVKTSTDTSPALWGWTCVLQVRQKKRAGLLSSRYDMKGLELCHKSRTEKNWTCVLQVRKKRAILKSPRKDRTAWNGVLSSGRTEKGWTSASRNNRKGLDLCPFAVLGRTEKG